MNSNNHEPPGEQPFTVSPVLQIHLIEMMSWFADQEQLDQWAGPNFRYPFDLESFTEDLRLQALDSLCLIDNKSRLVAFGQVYERVGRCHLGRLVVSPRFRGQGAVAVLMNELIRVGTAKFATSECSLFVLEDNKGAIRAYEKAGFKTTEYPEPMPLENTRYMVK